MASTNRNRRIRIYDIDRLTELESVPPVRKSNDTAQKYRRQGNAFFAKKKPSDYLQAIALYNKSICFAATGTEDVSIGYANRSAVFFELQMYDVCLKNVELAQSEYAYPARLEEKLQRRKTKCCELLAASEARVCEPLRPRLSFSPQKKIPFITGCLELREDNKFGRYVVTNRDIQVGQIIAIEEPFCTIVDIALQYKCCHNCGLENQQSLIPCRNCPHVMFCSAKCYEEGQRRYHRFECPVIDYLHSALPDNYSQSTLRIFLCALTSFETTDQLLEFVQYASIFPQSVFNVDYNGMKQPMSHAYGPIFAMQEGPNSTFSIEMNKLLSHIAPYLVKNTDLGNLITMDQLNPVIKILKHHHYTTLLNLSAISRISEKSITKTSLSKSVYAFRSLLNHSCSPNVMTTGYGNKVLLSAMRPIKTGEQIFDNYGVCHTNHDLLTRKRSLMFNCECIACEQKYPTLGESSIADIPIVLSPEIIERILAHDRQVAINHLPEVEEYLQEYDRYYPCQQLLYVHDIYAIMCSLAYDPEVTLELVLEGLQYRLEN